MASLDDGTVDDLAAGSSPTTATHAAVLRRPGEHGVANSIAASIETRPLAVPDPDNAVVLCVFERHGKLAAHHGGGGEFFVDSGLDEDWEIRNRGVGAT